MTAHPTPAPAPSLQTDPLLDLVLQRTVDVSCDKVWAAWTTPDLLMQWFCPLPWKTVECDIDLRPGGAFKTVMQSPEGERFPGEGCYLEVVPQRRLTWTSVLKGGFRPSVDPSGGPDFTCVLTLEPAGPNGQQTIYTAHAMHRNPEGAPAHAKMGFQDGWGAALDQLVALMKGRAA